MLKKDNSKNWIKKIYAYDKKICKFQDNTDKVIAKIGKIYMNIV